MSEARIWDRLAGRYETIVRLFDASYDLVRDRMAREFPPGGRRLELAAGTGQFTVALARGADHLVTTDIAPEMVGRLREKVEKIGLPGIECTVMSAYDLDAQDGSFDGVFCANALHVMDEPTRALAEIRRVLKPGGLFVAPTFLHGVDGMRRGLSRALSLVSPFVAHTRFDLSSLEATISAAGFDIISAEQLPGLFPLGYVVARPQRDSEAR